MICLDLPSSTIICLDLSMQQKQMDHRFTLTFDALTTVLPQLQNLLRISQLPFTEKQRQLQQLIARREESISFNHTWLGSLSERTIIETTGMMMLLLLLLLRARVCKVPPFLLN